MDVGTWVEFTRDYEQARAGDRGRVTSTGMFGGHDITMEGGGQVTGVPADALRRAPGGTSGGGDLGCAVTVIALVSAAAVAAAGAVGWWA